MIYKASVELDRLFPDAAYYQQWMAREEVCESSGRYFPYTERHLHALWFDESIRPKGLKTSRGERVIVENPGRWNLEAGPDFRSAVLLIGREKRRVSGDAEIHITSGDWKRHGHHTDPRYEGVRFHITWFDAKVDDSLFPPGTVHISLANLSGIDLDAIDLTAYPYEAPHASDVFPFRPGRMDSECPDEIIRMLESAGQERLRQKTERMARMIHERGDAQTLYEETAVALGYKNNKAPFRRLAQTVPLSVLRQYGSDWQTVYAVLLARGGLLPRQPGARWSEESKTYLRSLWDRWWREEHKQGEALPMSRSDWNFTGLRPLNHPVRRICLLAQWTVFLQQEGEFWDLDDFLKCMEPCFWNRRISWGGKEMHTELIGEGRIRAIELNVFVPYRLAKGDESALKHLHVEPMNSVIRETAYMLFGPDHSRELYRSALARQGLIQIFHDFILTGYDVAAA